MKRRLKLWTLAAWPYVAAVAAWTWVAVWWSGQ